MCIYEKARDLYLGKIFELDEELPHLYSRLMKLNELYLFISKIKIRDGFLQQGGYVEVTLPSDEKIANVNVNAMIFPILLTESIRGILELSASFGLPDEQDLSNQVMKKLGVKSRSIELSTLQRCAGHVTSRTDITEAYQVGGAATKAAFEGHTGEMIALKRISNDPYQCTTEAHDIHKVANFEKKIPLEWINTDYTDMLPIFHQYARPLIQAELTPIYINGLPRHIYMKTP